jgi:hypothetical protein
MYSEVKLILKFIKYCVITLLMVSGCGVYTIDEQTSDRPAKEGVKEEFIGNPDLEEILHLDPDADILKYNDTYYVTNIDWVDEESLTKKEKVGKIKGVNESTTDFENFEANTLPAGAELYSTEEYADFILIVEYENEQKRYLAQVEG